MCCKGMLKRVLPFFLTLAVGLFIASFFVDLSPAPFQSFENRRMRGFREYQQLKLENMELRDRNAQLQERINQLERNPQILKYIVPDNDITSPPAPPTVRNAPHVVR
ncbi:MAG TPA: hypothetical protein VEV84_13050 [Pyrinomonadaceae bacterium]|nr:hypothetical protein [Pyrinomonadaceae bacterium]